MQRDLADILAALDGAIRLTAAIEEEDLGVQIAGVLRVVTSRVAELHSRCEPPTPRCPYEDPDYQAMTVT